MKINNILEEIEYYESIGKFTIADKLTVSLLKFAKDFDWNDIHGGGRGLQQNIVINSFDQFIRIHPDCVNCMQSANMPVIFNSKRDIFARHPNDPKGAMDEFSQQIINSDADIPSTQMDACKRCFQAFAKATPNQNTQSINYNNTQNNNYSATRPGVPPIPA